MCFKSKSSGDGGAAAREAARQASVQEGYGKIQRIFGGYSEGVDPYTGAINPAGKYYGSDGSEILGSAAVPGAQLFSNVNKSAGFDDAFYDKRSQDYVDYASPQLDKQYNEAVKELTYALSSSGRLNSSTRGTQFAKLQDDYNMQKTAIADKGRSYATDARSAVERSRADLVSLNSSLADPAQIASEAQGRLASLQAAPSFETLAPLFTNVGEGIATQADLERRQSSRYNTGLFTPSSSGSGSQRIIK